MRRCQRVNRQDAKGAENLGLVEPMAELDDLAHRVIDAAIEAHRLLGPGFLESVYEEALCVEFALRGIEFARQVPVGRTSPGPAHQLQRHFASARHQTCRPNSMTAWRA